jgi:putative spermidine/putrescine transport system ATP-binding protein
MPAEPLPPGGLTIAGVSHAFKGTRALSDISFAVADGEVVALLGPSGCGKSTLLRCIAGLIAPDHGTITLNGQDLRKIPARSRAIGMVFQNYALFPHLTVAENIAYGLVSRRLPKAEIKAQVAEMLRLVRLEVYADRLPRELSGGQQQRVAVARALAVRPSALLLDEPFGALDRGLRAELQDEFVRLQRDLGITTIMVTHDQEEAQTVADRLVVMSAGHIEQIGTPEQIYDHPASLFVNGFIGHANRLSARVTTPDGLTLTTGEAIAMGRTLAFLPGTEVVLTTRPEHAAIVEAGTPGSLTARWVRSAPLAHLLSVDMELPDRTAVKALIPRDAGLRPAPGAAVGLTFDLSQVHVFPRP